ncbi:MAG: S41 family peptidase [Acidaminococcaceae bacterium]
MFAKKFNLVTILLVCMGSCLLTAGGILYSLRTHPGEVVSLGKIWQTMTFLQTNYIGDVTEKQLYEGALKGMVAALDDPYSVYLDERNFSSLTTSTEGHFGGIGVVIGSKENAFVIIATLDDTPGYRAGIKSGDKILAINGQDTAGQQLEEVAALIRGEVGTTLELNLQNGKDEARVVRVVRSDIKLESVKSELKDDKLGYIRIRMFNEDTGRDFVQQFHELEAQGMRGLVLDLRENPGGLLSTSVRVAQLLVPKGPIVSVTEKSGKTQTEYSTLAQAKYPVAVLVNQGSASAAEIVAGALQDSKAGKLFGTKTFGKGSVQSVSRLSKDTGVKLTIAHYFTPSGRSINGVGIEPDVVVEAQEGSDNQLEAALEYLTTTLNNQEESQ